MGGERMRGGLEGGGRVDVGVQGTHIPSFRHRRSEW